MGYHLYGLKDRIEKQRKRHISKKKKHSPDIIALYNSGVKAQTAIADKLKLPVKLVKACLIDAGLIENRERK